MKKVYTGFMCLIFSIVTLNGMNNNPDAGKKKIYDLDQLKRELHRTRQEVQQNRSGAFEEIVTRSRRDDISDHQEVKINMAVVEKK